MSEHRDKAVEAVAKSRYARSAFVTPWGSVNPETKAMAREGAVSDLQAAEPHLERMYFERLARQGGDLPEVFRDLYDPEADLGVLVRAALTVAEEDAVERFREAVLSEATRNALYDAHMHYQARAPHEQDEDGWTLALLEAALSRAQEVLGNG